MPTATDARLAQLVAASKAYLAQKEADALIYGEPEDSPAYHQLLAELAAAEWFIA